MWIKTQENTFCNLDNVAEICIEDNSENGNSEYAVKATLTALTDRDYSGRKFDTISKYTELGRYKSHDDALGAIEKIMSLLEVKEI